MNKRQAAQVTSGTRVRYAGQQGTVMQVDDGPGSDPRVKYPLFLVAFDGQEKADWITYRLLEHENAHLQWKASK